ncbi:MAG: VCBS repeat-containing protein, partial [Pyrinomonadaceae bacterium]|nr:VCBS repeat-containing protein [Pyrinomonadaceae bacterium]
MTRMKQPFLKTSALVGMCLLLGVISSQAANLTVTTTADGGFGSLRQAIIDATTNAAANTVSFNVSTSDSGYDAATNRFTINLLSPLPNLPLAPLTISNNQPQGLTVKGNNSFRVFTLVNSAVVVINNLTISNGLANNGLGGGIFMGNSSTLNLNGCTVSNNAAAASGGGVYMSNSGTLFLTNSTVRGNTATNGGGIYIFDSGTLNLSASTINANTAGGGGNGGGIFNGVSGTINSANSTIDGNSAGNNGGGIYNTATMTLTNNTVSSNTAGKGGGVYNTFTATLNNNIVALNTAADGNDLLGRGSLGNAYTGTYNLIGNADGSEGLANSTNQIGSTANPIDPRIGILRDNGGATLTRAVLTRSPAIDKGNSPAIITDQRGQVRPFDNPLVPNAPGGNGADIGAFERTFSPTPFDFDGDGKADVSVFRPSNGAWYLQQSSAGFTGVTFGFGTDKLVPADYDGDGKTDVAVYRSGTWYLQRSSLGFTGVTFGDANDIPVPADYDGDGKADIAVFRPSNGTWYLLRSNLGFTGIQFGISTDKPVPADYNGDGIADVAVFRPSNGTWYTS